MDRLAKYLSDTQTSQAEFGRTIGVSQPTVCDWIAGKKFPSRKKLKKIVERTGISADELLGLRAAKTGAH